MTQAVARSSGLYLLPPLPRPFGRYPQLRQGVGDVSPQTTQTIRTVSGIVTPVATALLAAPVAGLLGLGGSAAGAVTAAGMSMAIPIVGAAIAGLTFAVLELLNTGCGQSCVITSQWANQAAGTLHDNLSQYFAIPTPRPMSIQKLAVANFDVVWNDLKSKCSQPGLSTAGQNCITDRQAGACKWKATAPEFPGEPQAGACWNWFNAYRDPIAHDPNIYDDTPIAGDATTIASAVNAALPGLNLSGNTLLLIGGGLLLLLAVAS